MSIRARAACISMLSVLVLPAHHAGAIAGLPIDSHVVVAGANYYLGDSSPKLPLELTVTRGQKLMLTNLDPSAAHTLISMIYDSNGFPIFTSPPGVGFRATAEIVGVPQLALGTYGYYCTLHPGMEGTLIVEPPIGG